jgi:hypothetical protein
LISARKTPTIFQISKIKLKKTTGRSPNSDKGSSSIPKKTTNRKKLTKEYNSFRAKSMQFMKNLELTKIIA